MKTTTSIAAVATTGQGKKFNVLGHSITTMLTKTTTAGHYYVFECVTPPGLGIPPHVHDTEDELIYVVEGEFEITVGDRQVTAKAGDEIFFPKHIPHAFQNSGSKAGKTLWTVVPGANFEAFFDQLSGLPADNPDFQKVAEIFAGYGMEILVNTNA